MRDGVVDIYVHVLCEDVENSVVIFRSCFGFFLERLSLSLSLSLFLQLVSHITSACLFVYSLLGDGRQR